MIKSAAAEWVIFGCYVPVLRKTTKARSLQNSKNRLVSQWKDPES